MDVNEVLRRLGGLGRYQWFLFIIIGLSTIPGAWNNMGIVFIAAVPPHWCAVPELQGLDVSENVIRNITIPLEEKDDVFSYSSCTVYNRNYSGWTKDDVTRALSKQNTSDEVVGCRNGWVYDKSVYTSTVISQFDLVCERRWLQATARAAYLTGLLVGSIIFAVISDMLGRRWSYISSMIIRSILGIVMAFSPNFVTFYLLRVFLAAASMGCYATMFVIGLELCEPKYRVIMSFAMKYAWSSGYLSMAGLAYNIRSWFVLQLATTVPCLLMLGFCFVMPESLRWLLAHGKYEQANKLVERIAKWNRVPIPHKFDDSDIKSEKKQKYFFWDLFKTPRMRIRMIIIVTIWCISSMGYYGLSYNSSKLGGNDYINFCIAAAVEFPSLLFVQFALTWAGRRWTMCASMCLAGSALLCRIAVPKDIVWLNIALTMFGKMCIASSFHGAYLYTADLCPTVVRNMGIGLSSFSARIGGIAAQYIMQLSDIRTYIPMIILGSFAVFGGLIGLALPETKGLKLPETLEDGENLGQRVKRTKSAITPTNEGIALQEPTVINRYHQK